MNIEQNLTYVADINLKDVGSIKIREQKTIQNGMSGLVSIQATKNTFEKLTKKQNTSQKNDFFNLLKHSYSIDLDNFGCIYLLSTSYNDLRTNRGHSVSGKNYYNILPSRYVGQSANIILRLSQHINSPEKLWWIGPDAQCVFVTGKILEDNIRLSGEKMLFDELHKKSNCILQNKLFPTGPNSKLSWNNMCISNAMYRSIQMLLKDSIPDIFDPLREMKNDDFSFMCALANYYPYAKKNNRIPSVIVGVAGVDENYLMTGSYLVNEKYVSDSSKSSKELIERVREERQQLYLEGAIKKVLVANLDNSISDYYTYEVRRPIFFDKISSVGHFTIIKPSHGQKDFKVYSNRNISDVSYKEELKKTIAIKQKTLISNTEYDEKLENKVNYEQETELNILQNTENESGSNDKQQQLDLLL